MMRQSGFTLIEAMVAGIVSLIIPGVLIALFSNVNRGVSTGTTAFRLTQIATSVSDELQQAGQFAVWAYKLSDVPGATCPATAPSGYNRSGFQDGVVFCDKNRVVIGGFRLRDTRPARSILEEYSAVQNSWQPMVFSADTVKVLTNPNAFITCPPQCREQGVFGIGDIGPSTGAWAWFNFRIDMEIAGQSVTLPIQMQSVVCRNFSGRN